VDWLPCCGGVVSPRQVDFSVRSPKDCILFSIGWALIVRTGNQKERPTRELVVGPCKICIYKLFCFVELELLLEEINILTAALLNKIKELLNMLL